MIDFHRLQPQDREKLHEILYSAGRQGCEYSFANLFLWGRQEVAQVEGWLAIFSHYRHRTVYAYPVGTGDPKPVLDRLMEDARQRGIPFRMFGMRREEAEAMEAMYPGRFHFGEDRDSFDYIYDIARLAELKGKKLQGKRNHVNRFLKEHETWRTEPITRENLSECCRFVEDWYAQHQQNAPEGSFKLEQLALERAFGHLEALGMEGLLLYAEDRVVAMTLGNGVSRDTWDVNFEKADANVDGTYPMINRCYARYIQETHPEVRWLNREDDMGLPGLRKAKESYYPDILLEKYSAVLLESYE